MIKKILFFFLICLALLFFTALHIGLTYLLPYPFSKLNLLFVLMILGMVWWESGWVVWVAFFAHLFIELFSLTPFGMTLFAATMAMLFSYWLYEEVITNRSPLAMILLSFLTLLIYRLMYLGILFSASLFLPGSMPNIGFLLLTFFWEILFSCSAVAILSLLYYPWVRRIGSHTISFKGMYGRYR